MVEKAVKNNFFHHFREKETSSEICGKSGKSCQNQFFPRLKPFWRPKSWKKLVLTTFSTISVKRKLPHKSVEKVEKLSKPTFSTTQAVLEAQIVEKVGFDNFFHHFRGKKTSSEICGKSGKSCQNQFFPRLKPFWRPKSWKKLVLTTFSTISMIPKTFSKIRGTSGKSWPGQHFPRQFPLLLVVRSLQTF